MGHVIDLAARRADRSRPTAQAPVAFYVDLSDPYSYLAAERVERELGEMPWIPVAPLGPFSAGEWADAERAAGALRLPLVRPENIESGFPRARRAAAAASEQGAAADFVLAALRLAFCGGFDIDDPEILTEAALAADLTPDWCLAAVIDRSLDTALAATAAGLRRRGVDALPAVRIGRTFRHGVAAVAESSAVATVARPR